MAIIRLPFKWRRRLSQLSPRKHFYLLLFHTRKCRAGWGRDKRCALKRKCCIHIDQGVRYGLALHNYLKSIIGIIWKLTTLSLWNSVEIQSSQESIGMDSLGNTWVKGFYFMSASRLSYTFGTIIGTITWWVESSETREGSTTSRMMNGSSSLVS